MVEMGERDADGSRPSGRRNHQGRSV